MIRTTIYRKPGDQFKGFQVLGHADSVEEGADLVCCAVSVLTINLVNSLKAFADDPFELVQDERFGLVQLTFKEEISCEAALLMRSYELGLKSLLPEYDRWLEVIIREV